MSYYNYVYVIFTNNQGEIDYRTAGQILPAGSIPVAIANYNNKTITEIINEYEEKEIIDFVKSILLEVEIDIPKFIFIES